MLSCRRKTSPAFLVAVETAGTESLGKEFQIVTCLVGKISELQCIYIYIYIYIYSIESTFDGKRLAYVLYSVFSNYEHL